MKMCKGCGLKAHPQQSCAEAECAQVVKDLRKLRAAIRATLKLSTDIQAGPLKAFLATRASAALDRDLDVAERMKEPQPKRKKPQATGVGAWGFTR